MKKLFLITLLAATAFVATAFSQKQNSDSLAMSDSFALIDSSSRIVSRWSWRQYDPDPALVDFGTIHIGLAKRELSGGLNTIFGNQTSSVAKLTGVSNSLFGYNAGGSLTTGFSNALFGQSAGGLTSTGYRNTMVGFLAGGWNVHAADNVYVGFRAGTQQSARGACEANFNVMVGMESGYQSQCGSQNTFIGHFAGRSANGSRNVFIGKDAGRFFQGDDRLQIANNSARPPLIDGFFGNETGSHAWLKINGLLVLSPMTVAAGCELGSVSFDDSYLYICVSGSQWKRLPLEDFKFGG